MDASLIIVNLITLTLLEIILGIDNLVFIAIVSERLPKAKQKQARQIGLALALLARFVLLFAITWIIKLEQPLFSALSFSFSGKDLFMLFGGLFLLAKGTWEIHNELESVGQEKLANSSIAKAYAGFMWVIVQIIIFDLVFSLDSILTAVGLTRQLWIMMVAITFAVILMMIASEPLAAFIKRHPTIKMLALSFLILIGTVLVADGFGYDVPKAYIYFSISFSLSVEVLNTVRRKRKLARLGWR